MISLVTTGDITPIAQSSREATLDSCSMTVGTRLSPGRRGLRSRATKARACPRIDVKMQNTMRRAEPADVLTPRTLRVSRQLYRAASTSEPPTRETFHYMRAARLTTKQLAREAIERAPADRGKRYRTSRVRKRPAIPSLRTFPTSRAYPTSITLRLLNKKHSDTLIRL
jgi:hypothetical protein